MQLAGGQSGPTQGLGPGFGPGGQFGPTQGAGVQLVPLQLVGFAQLGPTQLGSGFGLGQLGPTQLGSGLGQLGPTQLGSGLGFVQLGPTQLGSGLVQLGPIQLGSGLGFVQLGPTQFLHPGPVQFVEFVQLAPVHLHSQLKGSTAFLLFGSNPPRHGSSPSVKQAQLYFFSSPFS